ncbi:MAG: hypothetical protein RI947_744 [Candidatus Parcubacteria bacterium]|jgi:hypothetical protein
MMKKLLPPVRTLALYYSERSIAHKPYAVNLVAYWLDRALDILLGI